MSSGERKTNVSVVNNESHSNGEPSSTANELPEAVDEGDKNDGNSCTSSSVAKGLSSVISSIIKDFDSQAQQTVRSQDQLSAAIDRLTNELDQLLEDAPSPFIMQNAAKISAVRKRISSLNLVLKSIQQRVDNIDLLVSAGLPNDKMTSESAAQR